MFFWAARNIETNTHEGSDMCGQYNGNGVIILTLQAG